MRQKIVLLLAVTAVLAGCDMGPKSAAGFRLPDGDATVGQAVFVELDCTSCHTVRDLSLPPASATGPVSVELGGQVTHVKNYGDLVTSIINPSHKLSPKYPVDEIAVDGQSKMTIYNDVMTVQQVVDLVAFLQPRYKVVIPAYGYRGYAY